LYLQGASVGAPPDALALKGQDWGIPPQDPNELRTQQYQPFIGLVRNMMRYVAALRFDHVMTLYRLWWVPRGLLSKDGTYVHYPLQDLIAILALESQRHHCIVIGEDLGTLPEGFHQRMENAGILGMKVLWFEQEQDGRFRAPRHWPRNATAMTTTHDLPTVLGWWRGRDIEWRESLSRFPSAESAAEERRRRERDREALWSAFRASGAASGGQDDSPPAAEDADAVLDAALAHTGGAACRLAILPV
jgi:4-alpha-glucanotransferase